MIEVYASLKTDTFRVAWILLKLKQHLETNSWWKIDWKTENIIGALKNVYGEYSQKKNNYLQMDNPFKEGRGVNKDGGRIESLWCVCV